MRVITMTGGGDWARLRPKKRKGARRLSNSSPNVTVSFFQIHRTDEGRRKISQTVVADYNAQTFARAARRRKLAGLVRWLRAETRGTPASHPSSKPFRSIPLIR